MEVLVHVLVFECIVRGFLCGVDGGVKMLELEGEFLSDFEWVGHDGVYISVECRVFWRNERVSF